MQDRYLISFSALIIFLIIPLRSASQYHSVEHRVPSSGEIPVSEPGSYGIPGTTYVLVRDISSPRSTIFLGNDVTLDLNGYTISYADGNYGHVPNYGFEEGLKDWDISKAPGAEIENTEEVHSFIGGKILRLKSGDEISSGYIYLQVGGRSYYAMCGVTGNYYSDMKGDLSKDMRVSIYVEDTNGKPVRCITRYSDSSKVSCPVINHSARLGGGFVVAHLNNLPEGRYRVRVRAENDCLVDEIDIRPAMDSGIGIVGRTHPVGHYDHLFNNRHSAFFDYTADVSSGMPFEGIPVVIGPGTIKIKNGIINNASTGILSWGIQSTARDAKIILDNVSITTSGINTTAVDVEQAVITNCRFDVINPFIINRHGSEFYAVDLRGEQPSEVSFSEFHGGQGCLCIKGKSTIVHNNIFVNRQTVTNHYSIMAMGDGSRIYENRFEPEIGSGIEIYRNKFIEIFNNEFHINAAPPSCEYPDHLSTNAIRIADYGAVIGSPEGCYGNRIYNNRFFINGRKYAQYPDFIPMVSAVFYSASAGDNEIFENEISVKQANPGTNAEAFAFYIGNADGGKFYKNKIVSNVTPIWIASAYGGAVNTVLSGNTVAKSAKTDNNFKPVRMGSGNSATGIEFRSNIFQDLEFGIDATKKPHSYKVYWTLEVILRDDLGKPVIDNEITIRDRYRNKITSGKSGPDGSYVTELPEYKVDEQGKKYFSPYVIDAGKEKTGLTLNKNRKLTLLIK